MTLQEAKMAQSRTSQTLNPAVKSCGGDGVKSVRQVEALSTAVRTPHVTNNPIITRVALEEALLAEFECDTAASHSVMSAEFFTA